MESFLTLPTQYLVEWVQVVVEASAIFRPVVRVEVTEAMGQLVITMAPLDKFMETIISPTSSVDLVEQDQADERQMVVVVVVLFR